MAPLWKHRRVFALAAVFAALAGLTKETILLRLQDGFDIPGRRFRVGLAEFNRPGEWLLLASREAHGDSPRLYGMVPMWLVQKPPGNDDLERFYIFRDGIVTLSFIETSERKVAEAAEALARSIVSKKRSSFKLQRGMFHGYDSLEWRDADMSMIIIPSLRASITVKPPSGRLEAAISMVE